MTTEAVTEQLDRLRTQHAADVGPDDRLTIAEVAQRAGVSAHTLRYYERIGLLTVPRDGSGYRLYSAADYTRVIFLTRLRMTGMPIRELLRYVALVAEGDATVPQRLQMLQEHRAQVRARIEELTFALEIVDYKIATYGGHTAP